MVEIATASPTGCDISGLGVPGGVLGGVRFRFSAAASADSTKVVIGKCDAGSTAILRTSDDTPVLDMPAPLSTVTPPNGGNALPQNPVFVWRDRKAASDLGLQTSARSNLPVSSFLVSRR